MIRGLSKREKILVVVLVVIVIVVAWYKLIYEPVNNQTLEYETLQQTEETEYVASLPQLQKMQDMEAKLEVLRANGESKRIPLYDNSKQLMVALNHVMLPAGEFQLDFGKADSDDYIVFHTVGLSFRCDSYKAARSIIDKLAEDTYTNQISDVNITTYFADEIGYINYGDNSMVSGTTNVDLVITFYEVSDE